MKFPIAHFVRFCAQLEIPSKDEGLVRMGHLYGTQRYLLREIAAGLEDDVHDFLVLKGRQQGITTITDALDVYWPQKYDGIQGMAVADDEPNRVIRRDIVRQMLYSLPTEYRLDVRADNGDFLAWSNGSRLMFAAAAARTQGSKTKLGRGRGVSYVHGDEFDAWTNPRAVKGFRASLSDRHPYRLSTWASTAQGYGVLHDAWKETEGSPTTRRIFIPWWLHELYRVEQTTHAIWEAYGRERPTDDERLWMMLVEQRYGYRVQPEQLVWRRWKLATDFLGDEAMLMQEHPNLPEDAFQTFGDVFFRPALIRSLRERLTEAPTPTGWKYVWGRHLDESRPEPCEPGSKDSLTVWEEPDQAGVYIVSCHPAFSSTPLARDDVVQVWRAYPDKLEQAAEYVLEGGGLTRHCAWAAMHLAGAYRMRRRYADVYFILDVEMTGIAVLREIERLEQIGWGLSPQTRSAGRELEDLLGAVRHYFFRNPYTLGGTFANEWKSQANFRPWLLNQLRDVVEDEHVEIRSPALIDELATVRRGESAGQGADQIAGGGIATDCRVIAAAMACEFWLTTVQHEIQGKFPTKAEPRQDRHVGEVMVGNFLAQLEQAGRKR
jgi:hypothetical protein